jgi:hypothetical protein
MRFARLLEVRNNERVEEVIKKLSNLWKQLLGRETRLARLLEVRNNDWVEEVPKKNKG